MSSIVCATKTQRECNQLSNVISVVGQAGMILTFNLLLLYSRDTKSYTTVSYTKT